MSNQTRIGKHATTITKDGQDVSVRYHETVVFEKHGDVLIVRHGGYVTSTTRTRINQACYQFKVPARAYIKDLEMWIDYNGVTYPVTKKGTTISI